jgi:hypothetical protein
MLRRTLWICGLLALTVGSVALAIQSHLAGWDLGLQVASVAGIPSLIALSFLVCFPARVH